MTNNKKWYTIASAIVIMTVLSVCVTWSMPLVNWILTWAVESNIKAEKIILDDRDIIKKELNILYNTDLTWTNAIITSIFSVNSLRIKREYYNYSCTNIINDSVKTKTCYIESSYVINDKTVVKENFDLFINN